MDPIILSLVQLKKQVSTESCKALAGQGKTFRRGSEFPATGRGEVCRAQSLAIEKGHQTAEASPYEWGRLWTDACSSDALKLADQHSFCSQNEGGANKLLSAEVSEGLKLLQQAAVELLLLLLPPHKHSHCVDFQQNQHKDEYGLGSEQQSDAEVQESALMKVHFI